MCDDCGCELEYDGEPTDLIIYSRKGTEYFQHKRKKCKNRYILDNSQIVCTQFLSRFCNKSFFHGYSVKAGVKKYDADILNGEYLSKISLFPCSRF